MVNKALSAKYDTLVAQAPKLIEVLPWGKDFEVETFRKPDFTALEVVSFATGGEFVSSLSIRLVSQNGLSGIPAGINVMYLQTFCVGHPLIVRLQK